MNQVECQVSNCQHYDNNMCGLNQIRIDGPAAKEKSQTCCMSFDEKRFSMQNAVGVTANGTPDTGIQCKADNCAHNRNAKCEAPQICIGCTCQDASSKSSTECATFVER